MTLEKGQRAPFDGVLLTNADLALLEKELQAFEEMNEALKGDLEKLKAQYSDELDKAYKTFDANSDAILKQIEAIDNTPIIIDETAWWEPVAWVVTGAAIVGVIWVVDSAL